MFPTFFVPGQGSTPFRQLVLGSAVAMFALAAIVLRTTNRKSLSRFAYWYFYALALIAVGLLGTVLPSSFSSVLFWTGRAGQWLGGVYMLIAAIASVRESRVWGVSLEAALHESEERFRLLVEGAKDHAIFMLDPDGRVISWNSGAEAIRGYTAQEIIGRHWSCFYLPEEVERGKPEWLLKTAAERGVVDDEGWRVRKDGSRFWAEVTLSVLRDDSGRIQGFSNITRDITERKRAEIESRAREQRLRLAADAAQLGIFEWTVPTDTVVWENKRMYEIFGIPETTDPVNRDRFVRETLHPEDLPRFSQELEESMQPGALFRGAYRIRRVNDGQWRWIQYFSKFELTPDGKPLRLLGVLEDITERKQAEYVLREQAELLEIAHDTIMVRDLDGTIRFWNHGAEGMYGYSKQQATGRISHDLLQTVFPKPLAEIEADVLRIGRWEGELIHTTQGGTHMVVASRWVLQRNKNGQPYSVMEINNDITEHKCAEDELRQNQEWLRVTLTSIGDAVLATDLNGRVTFLNPIAAGLTGWQMEEAKGQPSRNILRTINERTRVPAEDIIALVLKERRAVELANHTTLLARDGREIPIEDSAAPILDIAGNVVGVVLVFHDVTEVRRAQEALHRLSAIVESSDDAIIGKTMEGVITSWNLGAERLYGYSAAEIVGQPISVLIPADHPDELPGILRRLANGERIEQYETLRRRKDGSSVPVLLKISSILDGSGNIVGASTIARDITERKRTEEALLRAEKLASVGRMASTIAHEINNPLETIGHAVYLALADPATSPKAKSYLELANQELERVTHITKQTLAFNRENKTPTLIDLRASVDSVVKLFAPRLKAREITVEKRYAEVECIRAGGGEIQQVISNLLSNSMDATPKHGKIEFRISRSIGRNGSRLVRVTIADTGSGIHPERLKKIFEPFFTTKEMVGTGLGLWVTKQIVEKHGATIRVRSQPERGTVFSIAFPAAEELGKESGLGL
jgi:PAS domain S-box-containing protein